jgi:hypothetical protein
MSLYMIFAFDSKLDAEEFICTINFDLSKERKMVELDWSDISIDDLKEVLVGDFFEGVYYYFVLCEIEFEGNRLIEIENKKKSAS